MYQKVVVMSNPEIWGARGVPGSVEPCETVNSSSFLTFKKKEKKAISYTFSQCRASQTQVALGVRLFSVVSLELFVHFASREQSVSGTGTNRQGTSGQGPQTC